jgi:DNA repair exonuclease SbcCD nuclease subunit
LVNPLALRQNKINVLLMSGDLFDQAKSVTGDEAVLLFLKAIYCLLNVR